MRGVRRITDAQKLDRKEYWEKCQFDLKDEISLVLGYELLVEKGMFHKTKNRGGVVRDHRLSIRDAFLGGVDPELIRHPANCRFLISRDNASKTFKSEINQSQLIEEIAKWRM